MPFRDKIEQKKYYAEYRRRPEVMKRRNEREREQRKTPEGWAIQKYYDMKERCGSWKYYKDIKVLLTKEEFVNFVKSSSWKELQQPSVDRIDSKGNYELGNIQIIEKRENDARASRKYFGCMVEGCTNIHRQHGFCTKHFTRYVRRGTLDDMKRFGDKLRDKINGQNIN